MRMASELSQAALESLLAGVPFVSRVRYLPSTTSTNDVLKAMALAGASEGALVLADEQTAGRGRLNRRWLAPAGTSLLFSLLFRPSESSRVPGAGPQSPLVYTMMCSQAVRDAVAQRVGVSIGIKWPNDLVYGGCKLGGILTEVSAGAGDARYAIVGIGINVNWDPTSLAFDYPATSLGNVAGRPVARGDLLRAIVRRVADRYAELRTGVSPAREWESALDTIGREVVVELPDERLTGVAVGVDADGALLVRTSDGLRRVVAGDVRLRAARASSSARR